MNVARKTLKIPKQANVFLRTDRQRLPKEKISQFAGDVT